MGDAAGRPFADSFGWPAPAYRRRPWGGLQPPPGHGTDADRRWAVVCHLSLFPLGIVLPLVVVLVKGHRSPYVCHHAVEALNFQVTVLLAVFACSLLAVALIGLLLLPLVVLTAVGLSVVAAVRADAGAWYRYPLTLRLVS